MAALVVGFDLFIFNVHKIDPTWLYANGAQLTTIIMYPGWITTYNSAYFLFILYVCIISSAQIIW